MSVNGSSAPVFEAVRDRHRLLVLAGAASTTAGVVLAAYIAYEWFVRGTSHEVIAIVSAGALLLGVQLMILASLTSMLVTLHRELLARVDDDST